MARKAIRLTAFVDDRRVATGSVGDIQKLLSAHDTGAVVVLDDTTGRTLDLPAFIRLPVDLGAALPTRGRPKLGVTGREVTLLPRHWEWLATQRGGASAALRRLVDQARKDSGDADAVRQAQDVTYRVMTTLAGDRPGYEEATRALFARDKAQFGALTGPWPKDITAYLTELSVPAWPPSP